MRVGKFGAYTWNVTFTENHGQHPPGTGDMPTLVVDATMLTESNTSTCSNNGDPSTPVACTGLTGNTYTAAKCVGGGAHEPARLSG